MKNVILCQWLVYIVLLHKLWFPVIAELTVDCEYCQHSPDSYLLVLT